MKAQADKRRRAHRFGLSAELLAAWYLRCKGYRILASRYRNRQGEIDLVASRGNLLVAVEVKARKNFAECAESVTEQKRARITRAMEGLLAGQGKIAALARAAERDIRFDVIWVAPGCLPRHIKDAWRIS